VTRVEFSSFIEDDLDTIAENIAQDNPARAVSFIQEIRAKFRVIGQNPLGYRLHPEIGDDARMALVGRYVVLFHIVNDIARIERVAYGGRDLWAMFNEASS
jgi:plasmid stabilization system protein ParE